MGRTKKKMLEFELEDSEFDAYKGLESDYTESDVSFNLDKIEIEEVKISWQEKIQIILSSIITFRYFLEILTFVCLFILSFKKEFNYHELRAEKKELVKDFLQMFYIGLWLHLFIDLICTVFCNLILAKTSSAAVFCMHLVALSTPISSICGLIVFYYLQETRYGKLYLLREDDKTFTIQIVVLWLIFIFILILIKNFIFQKLKIAYNYTNYLNRIRRCIIDSLVVKLLKIIDSDRNTVIERVIPSNWFSFFEWRQDVIGGKKLSDKKLNILIEEESLEHKNRIIIMREFNKLIESGVKSIEDPIKHKEKFKKNVYMKSRKIFKRLSSKKINNFSRLGPLFQSKTTFKKLMRFIGVNPDAEITMADIIAIVERMYKEKFYLRMSLEQINGALKRLELSSYIFLVFLALLALLVVRFDISASLAAFFSTIFGTNFVLISLTADLMNGIIFLFCMHPYDIGDRVFVELDGNVENLVVKELNVLSTVFYNFEGVLVTVPNSQLIEKMITNVRRCGNMAESHPICINVDVDMNKIAVLKKNIKKFLQGHKLLFTDFFMMNFEKIEDGNKLIMRIFIQYRRNWQNYEYFLERRTVFFLFLIEEMKSLGIQYKPLTQKIELVDL